MTKSDSHNEKKLVDRERIKYLLNTKHVKTTNKNKISNNTEGKQLRRVSVVNNYHHQAMIKTFSVKSTVKRT